MEKAGRRYAPEKYRIACFTRISKVTIKDKDASVPSNLLAKERSSNFKGYGFSGGTGDGNSPQKED
jgi:hypothetical protein